MPRDPFLLRRAREFRREQTAAEERMWWLLRGRELAGLKFRRQHVVGGYIADFVCIGARLVIEIDGATHGDEEAERDAKRTKEFEKAGYSVIRFWNDDVLNDRDGGVAEVILEAVRTSALLDSEKARLIAEGLI
jgi:very-short-patch-repair endonuclease